MDEPITCAQELEELALALELEVEPLAAEQLEGYLEQSGLPSSRATAEVRRGRRRFVEWQTNVVGLSRRQEGKRGFFGEETLPMSFRPARTRQRAPARAPMDETKPCSV